MERVVGYLLLGAALFAAPGKRAFKGSITDDMCAKTGHAQMQMGPTDGECTIACVAIHGASYVLTDGKNVFRLSDQRTPERFAGRKVRVVGTLNLKTSTIQVDSISAAE